MGHPFVDETTILVRSGRGGDGCVSFRREKYEPRGGPDGGDGGRGGHVIMTADSHVSTLLDMGRNHHHTAESGVHGKGKNRTGRCGEDLVLRVPVGTIIRRVDEGTLIADLTEIGQSVVVAEGGRGGRGNKAFATPTHQAPREHEAGGDGEEFEIALELKLMADVGMLGLPNAGKSTFLARVSEAKPRIASYPFTTLRPQLGIAELDTERRLVIADIPGLIEGAHQGVGLGMEFLRHLERTRALIHLVDAHDKDVDAVVDDIEVIRREIRNYTIDLSHRPITTALNKADLMTESDAKALAESVCERLGIDRLHVISAVSGAGVRGLLDAVYRQVAESR